MNSKKETILVTGSSGLIGRAVCNRLASRFNVVGFDRPGPPEPPPTAECLCVDLTSDKSVKAGFERVRIGYGERIASVIHLAAYYDFSGEPSELYEKITVQGTERMLRELQRFQVEQFIFSSTMLVHAPCEPGQKIDEDWPIEPKWDYPKSKVETEKLIHKKRGNIPAVLMRIAGVYDDHCHSIPIAHQIQRIYEREITSKLFPGDISRGQSFIHLEDVIGAIELAVQCRKQLPPELAVLIGESETLSYDELQREFGRLIHNQEWETKHISKALAKTGAWIEDAVPFHDVFIKPWMIDLADDHYALDISRARKLLVWEPKHSLRETLPKMIEALKSDPVEFYKENKLGELPARDEMKSDDGEHEEHGSMPEMTRDMRSPWLWTNFTVISLGLWLISSPFTFGYASGAMCASDVVSGALLMFFAALALWPRFDFIGRWSASFVGGWLLFAPLIFWTPSAAAYLNDTLVGVLAIALTVLVPMMPGMAHHMEMMKPGPEIPPGWSYNPSSWHQRAPMITLAFIALLASRYLAAFQLGHLSLVWDPFFGDGTARVLTSDVSKMFPISDAGLGATAYTIEMLMGWMGGKTRWRTMPWMVTFFFILVVPLGVVSIVLVMLQPLAVGAWCSICLFTALMMLFMVPLAVDEMIATVQFLKTSVRNGKPFWRTFWVGGTLDEVNEDKRTPKYGAPALKMAAPMVWGVTVPWNLVVSAALGIWLMFAPAVFGTQGGAADSDHLVGALIVTVAVIVMAEVVRAGRYLNVLLGAWIIAAPWFLSGASTGAKWNDVMIGAAVIFLSLPRGTIRERYGAWDRLII